jgi:hypothetical protein
MNRVNKMVVSKTLIGVFISATLLTGCGKENADGNSPIDLSTTDTAFSSSQNVDFCSVAQTKISNTKLPVENIIYKSDDFEGFKKSKPVAKPLTTDQFVVMAKNPATGVDYPQQISCKMKTNDSIIKYNGEGTAGEESTCKAIQQEIINTVVNNFSEADKLLALKNHAGVVEAVNEEIVWIGPRWLKPWPWQSASTDASGKTAIKSKALFVVDNPLIPMPDRFKGTHYCHLATPEYIRLLATGEVKADVAAAP